MKARRGPEVPQVSIARERVLHARGRVRVGRLLFLALTAAAFALAVTRATTAALVVAALAIACAGVTGRFVRVARDARATLRRANRSARNANPTNAFESEQRSVEA